jgi:hypothetical protein
MTREECVAALIAGLSEEEIALYELSGVLDQDADEEVAQPVTLSMRCGGGWNRTDNFGDQITVN